MTSTPRQDLRVELKLSQSPTYVHPPRTLNEDLGGPSSLEKVITGDLTITAQREVRIGPVKVIWEVGHHPDGGERTVISSFVSNVTEEDKILAEGITDLPFTLTLSQLIPPYTRSPFDLIMSRLFVSILHPSPEYEVVEGSSVDNTPSGSACASPRPSSPSTPNVAQSSTPEPSSHKRGVLEYFRTRRKSTKPTGPDQPIPIPKTMSVTAYKRAWRQADIPLPMALRPSLAYASYGCGLVSSPDNPGEEPIMEWEKTMRIAGLGKVECLAYSSYFACGSGLDFRLAFTELEPLATIHATRLMMIESAVAGDGCAQPGRRRDITFTLHHEGDPYMTDNTIQPSPYVWRAEIPRFHDAARSRSGLLTKTTVPRDLTPASLVLPEEFEQETPDSLELRTMVRIPSPIIGAHATSPAILDSRLTRISHRLRLEVLFSVLGEDEHGKPLRGKKTSTNEPPEGTVRRLWVEHEVILRSCVLGPDNIKVPTYIACPGREESFDEYLTRIAIRQRPTCFGMESSEDNESIGEGGDLRERAEEHVDDCTARCLCFYGDEAIKKIISRKSVVSSGPEGSEIKASYRPPARSNVDS